MGEQRRKKWLWIAAGLCVYLALLRLLVFAEASAPEASILTMADAVWFSLVTVTTAGYGDLYPVTPAGRLVGTLFLLLSTGLLAVLISGLVLFASGRLLPRLRLFWKRRRSWYIFSALNCESAALARNLAREEPGAVMVFCGRKEKSADAAPGWLLADVCPEEILRWKGNSRRCTLLAMGPDSLANLARAGAWSESGAQVHCQTDFQPRYLPGTMSLFDRWECCARLYWQSHPLGREEEVILFCGFGRYAEALLEQALLVNIFPLPRRVIYHIFGENGEFMREHPRLADGASINETEPGRDSLIFHKESWDACPELLARADRILLCADRDEEQVENLRRIRRYFPAKGKIHIRLSGNLEGEEVFGSDEELFTPELVLRTGLDRIAVRMHEIYRRGTGGKAPVWEELSVFLRRSNLAAADHLLTKAGVLLGEAVTRLDAGNCRLAYKRYLETREERGQSYRETEHRRWARFYILNGWQYGTVRDNDLRTHPDLRPFEELSSEETAKDDYAWELLGALGDELRS